VEASSKASSTGTTTDEHKDLWPLDSRDIAALVVSALGLIVASGGEK